MCLPTEVLRAHSPSPPWRWRRWLARGECEQAHQLQYAAQCHHGRQAALSVSRLTPQRQLAVRHVQVMTLLQPIASHCAQQQHGKGWVPVEPMAQPMAHVHVQALLLVQVQAPAEHHHRHHEGTVQVQDVAMQLAGRHPKCSAPSLVGGREAMGTMGRGGRRCGCQGLEDLHPLEAQGTRRRGNRRMGCEAAHYESHRTSVCV